MAASGDGLPLGPDMFCREVGLVEQARHSRQPVAIRLAESASARPLRQWRARCGQIHGRDVRDRASRKPRRAANLYSIGGTDARAAGRKGIHGASARAHKGEPVSMEAVYGNVRHPQHFGS
jgi:hypothetical protein